MSDPVANDPNVLTPCGIAPRRKALTIALWYAVVGAAWILCSSRILRYLVADPSLQASIEDAKGWGFVFVTALLLGLLLDRYFRNVQLAVQRIQDGEAKLRLVGDNLPDAYMYQISKSPEGRPRFDYISAGVERVHGIGVAEVLKDAKSLLGLIDAEQMPAYIAAKEASARDLTDFEMELHWRRQNGEERLMHVHSRPRRDVRGRVQWDGFAQDITERKQAEEALRLQSAALEAAANAIIITDREGKIEWVNRAFTALTGYTKDEVVGQTPRLLNSGKHNQAFYQNMWQTVLAGNVWHSEMINRHKDGHCYTEEATITPVPDEHGLIRHFIAVKQDISQRKRAELELEQLHNQLLSASRQAAVAEFATGILHNVGNVLNSVGVASSCLAESLKKSKSARLTQVVGLLREHESDLGAFFTNDPKGKLVPGYLAQLADKLAVEQDTARQEIAALQTSLEHIKAIITVQQDSAKGSATREAINFTDLVEDALKMHSNALVRSDIQVIKQYEDLPPVLLQKHRVLQILVNLIRNAIQACDGSHAKPKELKIQLSRSQDRLRCAIADTGVGISSENLQRLFTFGFTTKQGGHGFGLHGALLTAQDMGGALSAQSEGLARGATFTLELPLQAPAAQS